MEFTTRRIGQCGEIAAARYLRDNDYDIITANYHTKMGEIDIVAMDEKGTMVFVEVKTRNEDAIANPSEWVTKQKQNKIIATALTFIKAYKFSGNSRFDVIEVFINKGGNHNNAKINHIENAFTTDNFYANI